MKRPEALLRDLQILHSSHERVRVPAEIARCPGLIGTGLLD